MTPMTNPDAAVLITRVSTGEQADSGLGLEAQLATMRAFCEREGLEIVSIHEDAGVSGRAALENRTGLVDALAAVVTHRAGVLLCAKLDRVSRDPLTLLTIEKTLKASGAKLVSASGEGTEGDDPSSVFMRRILSAVGEMEANLVSARTKAALKAKKARGERLGKPRRGFKVENGSLTKATDWNRVLEALRLREGGAPWRVCGEVLGCSGQAAGVALRKWGGSSEAFLTFTEENCGQ